MRVANVALAKRVHLSPTLSLDRVRRLECGGYIRGYRAELDSGRLGCGFVTFITVSLERTRDNVLEKFARRVRVLDEIAECHMVGGGFDYILRIRTWSMAAFRTFLGEKLSSLPKVAQTRGYFVMQEVKDSRALPIG